MQAAAKACHEAIRIQGRPPCLFGHSLDGDERVLDPVVEFVDQQALRGFRPFALGHVANDADELAAAAILDFSDAEIEREQSSVGALPRHLASHADDLGLSTAHVG